MALTMTGVTKFTIGITEHGGLFGGPKAIRMMTVDAANNLSLEATSLKRGVADRTETAAIRFGDLSAPNQDAILALREQVTRGYASRDSSIGVSLENAFDKTWDAGVGVQSNEGFVRSFHLGANEPTVRQAKALSHEVIAENPRTSGGTTLGDFLSHAFRIDELS
jgi:hypothetical protein